MSTPDRIAANVQEVNERIAEAAKRSGRSANNVTLVAVTKYSDAATTRWIVQAGCCNLGENRPQQLWAKADELSDVAEIRWHQIGHLQRNKVAKTVSIIELLHSVDSQRLLKEVDRSAGACGMRLPILLEVNVSGDETKHGWKPDEMEAVLKEAAELKYVEIRGLMTMATLGGSDDTIRSNFAELRDLRDRLQASIGDAVSLSELSMGMSGDYEVAIEEGATIVRVGSALLK